ncbi:tyrosine-type recombinase/integrase [Luteolibacter luteus]|uniref:Site-specific integrase n=1 Tax=Luteolibacter luteus TaxID=2728835 RepID=A0A858RMF0_9BACT|nr:site-specific integrase [Luteolibacter luteus]QJE98002.1 site-specific integrase [Luteolibacter luteus]
MKQKAQFAKSKVENLFRHRAGNYYAVTKVDGKVRRRCLETEDFNTAKGRLTAALNELRGTTNAKKAGTLAEAITDEALREDPGIKETTRHYYQQVGASLIATSDTLDGKPAAKSISKATLADLRSWMDAHAKLVSRTRYNGSLALLRRTYDRAIEAHMVTLNLADELDRLQPIESKRDLPTIDDFGRIVAEIIGQRKAHSKAAAAAVRLLASTGLRISEAQALKWGDITDSAIVIRTAKNDEFRRVPLTSTARDVLAELKQVKQHGGGDPVMPMKSPRLALEGACDRLGLSHLRIHDLRHIFATRCIEAGVDIPTIASWLGHKDGGALAAKTYGHVIEKHSEAQILKVAI